jgi:hypothetical protein
MADAESTLRGAVQPVLLPGEEILGVTATPVEPSRLWFVATGIGFILGLLPGLLLAIVVLVDYRDGFSIVATNRRLFLFKGRTRIGIAQGRRVVDLGTVTKVDEQVAGNTKRLTLHLRGGGTLVMAKVPRDATRGLSAATTSGFFEGFATWLSGALPQLQAQPPLGQAALKPPSSAGFRTAMLLKLGALGLLVLVGLGFVFKITVLDPRAEEEQHAIAASMAGAVQANENAQRAAQWSALGPTPEAQAWLAAFAARSRNAPAIQVRSPTLPPDAELQAVEQVARAAAGRGESVATFASADGMFGYGFVAGLTEVQHRFSRQLGQDPSSPPVDITMRSGGAGQVSVELHILPSPGNRVHRYGGTRICPLFDTTAIITATVTEGPTLTRGIQVTAPDDALLRTDTWQRFARPEQCLQEQSSRVVRAVTAAIGDMFLGEGVGAQ